mgnify:CR=1 FL=1
MDCGVGGAILDGSGMFDKFQSKQGPLNLHGCDHGRYTHDLNHAGQVVGEYVQYHLGGDVFRVRILKLVAPMQDLFVP